MELILKDLHSWIDSTLMWKTMQERPLNIYWGTATTGRPHLGYFVGMYKIADFLKAGCNVKILFADLHGFLDNMKSTWDLLEHRCNYYTFVIKEMLKRIGVDVESKNTGQNGLGKLEFVRGSTYQLEAAFSLDVYKMCVQVTTADALRAGAEVVKQQANPLTSNLIYPIMQALDEEHLGCDVQFGGVDQRKIFMFSRDHSHKLGYKKRGYLMNPLVPGLGKSGKMSSSEPLSKVDFDDSASTLAKKIRLAFCESPTEAESAENAMNNGLLAICKFILFRFLADSPDNEPGLVIEGVHYATYDALAEAFRTGKVHPSQLKPPLTKALETMLGPLRKTVTQGEGGRLLKLAYPDIAKAHAREAKLQAAAAAGPATFGAANVVVGHVDEVEPVDGHAGLFKAMMALGNGKQVPVASALLRANSDYVVLLNAGPHFPAKGVTAVANLLVAQQGDEQVALVPPAGCSAGDVVTASGVESEPVKSLKKAWAPIAALLQTDADGVPQYDGTALQVNGAPLPALAFKNASISNKAQ